MRRPLLALSLSSALAIACHSTRRPATDAGGPERLERRLVGVVAVPDSEDVPREALPALVPRVAALRLEPASVTLRVGDTVSLRSLVRVRVVDSAGASLGRLPVYDTAMLPGAAFLVGGGRVAGEQPSESDLAIGFPRALWQGRGDLPPVAHLRVEVRRE